MHYKLLWLSVLGGSMATAWLGYVLVTSYFQEWARFTSDFYPDNSFWIKTLALISWIMTAVFFLYDRNNLTRNR